MQRTPSKQVKPFGSGGDALLILFFLRAHILTGQEPFIDEVFSLARVNIWDFDSHPAAP